MEAYKITYETRRESFGEVLKSLGTRQAQVFAHLVLYENGITASELAKDMHEYGYFLTPDRNNVHPRLNEMVELGIIRVLGKRECRVTHKTVAVYQADPLAKAIVIGGLSVDEV